MRRITTLLLLLAWFSNAKAQDYKVVDSCNAMFIYSYQFYDVRKLPESIQRQEMVLEVGKKCSKFYNTVNQYTDSLLMLHANEPAEVAFSNIAPMIKNLSSHKFASFYVFKGYPKAGVTLFTASDMGTENYYRVEEELDFGWKVDGNAKTTIMGYTCTKATCRFAGRDYEAWFTTQIPISNGPYKFSGLPGLIVKVADNEGEHIFELQEVKNVKDKTIYFSDKEYVVVNGKGYTKALEASKAGFIEKLATLIKNDDRRARAISRIQRRNNFIERY